MKNISFLLFAFLPALTFSQQKHLDVGEHFSEIETSEILLLGTFHFNDAGLDSYKPEDIDVLTEKKQGELEEVLEHLREYAPTKIALEVKKSRQVHLDSLYNEYLAGRFELSENEIYQVGFRLAKSLGHKKVYAVDAEGRWYTIDLSEKEHQDKQNYFIGKADQDLLEREMKMDRLYSDLYAKKDELKMELSLLDYFLFLNDPEMLKTGHGHYIIGSFKMGEGDDYYGPDAATAWYNRNLRIFHNLLQLNEPGKDRLFVLIGAGHLPILDFLAASSPDLEKVELRELVRE